MIDVIFINPGHSKKVYQDLSQKYSAIEPPTWSLLLAKSCMSQNFKVKILDCNAEHLSLEEMYSKIVNCNPRLICFVVYGQNVNAGTTSMIGATELADYLKSKKINIPISFVGSHVQALPIETLKKEKCIDFVFTNEGVYALWNILKKKDIKLETIKNVKGIALRDGANIVFNPPEKIVPNDKMDEHLPGYAWELLPYKNKPLDLYRSPMWHAEYDENKRSPYAAIQTSLGCQFKCSFCMINRINREDKEEIGVANKYK